MSISLELDKKPFVRNVIVMATGTAAAQVITMALSPIITRLYGPESFGLLGVFTAIVAIFAEIAALTYPIAIVLPESDNVAKGLVRLSLSISVVIAVVGSFILLFFKQPIVTVFQIENIAPFLYLIPLVVLFSGLLQVIEQWLIRTKQFRITAKVSVLYALILQGGKIGIGFFHPFAIVLIILTVFGYGLKALMMIIGLKLTDIGRVTESSVESMTIKEIAIKYKDFPILRAPEVFINAISESIPILMLTSFFGPAAAGFYTIGRAVLNMPTQILAKSVGDVFYPRISEAAHNGENLTRLIAKTTFILGVVGLLPFGIVILFGPFLFSFVFGPEWLPAGEYARWIALWSFLIFMNSPSIRSLPVLSAQGFLLKYTIFSIITRFSVLAIGNSYFSNDLVVIACFGVSNALLNIALIIITLKISKNYELSRSVD